MSEHEHPYFDETLRFQRVVIDLEVEVVDAMAARASTLQHVMDHDSGETDVIMNDGFHLVPQVVGEVVSRALMEKLGERGLKFVTMSTLPRLRHPDGEEFAHTVVPGIPVRRDDGTYPPDFLPGDG